MEKYKTKGQNERKKGNVLIAIVIVRKSGERQAIYNVVSIQRYIIAYVCSVSRMRLNLSTLLYEQ